MIPSLDEYLLACYSSYIMAIFSGFFGNKCKTFICSFTVLLLKELHHIGQIS